MSKYLIGIFCIIIVYALTSCNNHDNSQKSNIINLEIPNNKFEVVTIINEDKSDSNKIIVFYTYDYTSNELLMGIDNDSLTISSTSFKSKSKRFTTIKINKKQIDQFIELNHIKAQFKILPNELFLKMILK